MVEFVFLAVVLLVPLVYLVITVARIQAGSLAVEQAAREASRAFDVLREAPVGPGLLNASDRAAFVVGQDGVIRYAWHETKPWLLPPFEEIKAALAAG